MESAQGRNPIQWISGARLDIKDWDWVRHQRQKSVQVQKNQYNVSVASWTMTTELVLLTITSVVQGFLPLKLLAILARTLNKVNSIFHSGGRQVYHRQFKAAVSQCYEQIKEEK
ncbi:hypothetical protein H5410_055322 [Solanum commersonii]|uniref:Uncharacterized protein n=1 Tax=Solanum commersonii TaxID=4109 RepID=A0A9J5WIZ7_SOLCO|nr:hypothetical protein H5410_055322 [Solanum commersonii]